MKSCIAPFLDPNLDPKTRRCKISSQAFFASFLFRSSATAEVLHVQLATPIVKCEHAWKLRKINMALMFNHKRSHPRTLAACGIMSIMMFFMLLIMSLLSRYYGLYVCCIVILIMVLLRQFGSSCHYHHATIVSI